MEKYNYMEAVKNDVLNYITENIETTPETDFEELETELNEKLWTADSITGNASGSYTFNRWTAEQNLFNNSDLIIEMIEDGFYTKEQFADHYLSQNFEAIDVSIRCYLLNTAIAETLEEIQKG